MTITCIISCAGYSKNIPVLQTCLQSLLAAKTATTRLIITVTTNNANHHIVKNSAIQFLIVSPKRAGFVGINNKAVQKTIQKKSDFYLIINDDAKVKENFFTALEKQETSSGKTGEILVPYIYESDKRAVDSFGVEYFKTGYTKNSSSPDIKTTLASMSCLLIRTSFLKRMIKTYGYFLNPILQWYLDDVEFSIRALAQNAEIIKCKNMIAYHERTFTWGRKSYFVMYQSFRNLLWVILLTWPTDVIRRHLFRILCWQLVIMMYCVIKYSPLMYPSILFDTLRHRQLLIRQRRHTIRKYANTRFFATLFSSLEIRHPRLTF